MVAPGVGAHALIQDGVGLGEINSFVRRDCIYPAMFSCQMASPATTQATTTSKPRIAIFLVMGRTSVFYLRSTNPQVPSALQLTSALRQSSSPLASHRRTGSTPHHIMRRTRRGRRPGRAVRRGIGR